MTEAHPPTTPVSLQAAVTALEAITRSVKDAQQSVRETAAPSTSPAGHRGPQPALAALLMLREVREQLAGWESVLIETARAEGASWAELAGPLGVASRQAAERRYLRLRPGVAGSTGEQRVQATRDSRAADRTVTAWARDNSAELRRLAGQVTSLTGLPAGAQDTIGELNRALAENDAARLVGPLTAARNHLGPRDSGLTDRVDAVIRRAEQLRRDSDDQRNS
ncbi:HSP18 transcriptional regulator [Streptomyces sp. NPDC059708]|uniref:HSP18 transcriptional regulator n=1 Tax=Streptomyces sp. NPDC059708 TaxID=3346916 RepID=UPI0036B066E6